MRKAIALVLFFLLCTTLTAFAQPDDMYQEQPGLIQQRPADCWPDQPGEEYFQPDRHHWYSLDISLSEGGSVTPDGLVRVREGETVVMTIRPNRGYHLKQVIIDGKRVNPELVYKFADIHRDHTAFIEFAPDHRR